MRQGKGVVLIAVLLIAVLGVAGFLAAGCGNKKNGTTSTTAAGGNQIEQILGHAPTGLAKQISDKGVIVIANDKAYPPQSYVDKTTGKLVGFDVDVANEVGKRLGVEVKFENPNWNSIPSGLKVDRYDVSIGSMTITQKRFDQGLDFSNPYYYTQGQVMIKQGSPVLSELSQLKGKKIGVGTATTYEAFLQAEGGVTIASYDTDADAFPDLKNGRLDGVMTADLTASEAIAGGSPFELSGKPYYYEELAAAIRQGEPDLKALLDYAIDGMHKDGTLTKLSEKWYHGFDTTKAPAQGVPGYDDALKMVEQGTYPGQ